MCFFCNSVSRSDDVFLDHVLTEHRDKCRGPETTGDNGGHSSSSTKSLNYTLETSVSDAKNARGTCGGPNPPKVSKQGKSVSHCTVTRKVLFQSTFPEVIRSGRVEINYETSMKCTSLDPDQYNCMPPLCQIDEILQNVSEGEAEIVLDYGCYSVETIRLFKKCHAGKVIQDQVRNEIDWAKQDNYMTVDAVSHFDKNYLNLI